MVLKSKGSVLDLEHDNQTLKDYISVFERNKMRLTQSRLMLLQCLVQHRDWHTLAELKHHLEQNQQRTTLASIYNNLKIFAKLKLINIFVDTNRFETYYCLRHENHKNIYFFDENQRKFLTLPLQDKEALSLIGHKSKHGKIKLNDFYIVASGTLEDDQ
ncbi:Fur family transcriptional regulator [Mycoplasmoides pneumoniae]|uniref:Fur family transcriptional regulator n=1 Tax=Mycoplasmoides pneumoniae TaxID=2104 RepID=UPI0027E14E65|nr:Fur family transcriptional regulator [Mycoplasmoides pneumoniae]